jgi:uncharacterized membrane protein
MPYSWIKTAPVPIKELHLWPHQSLPPKGFAIFIGATAVMSMFPLFPLIGFVALWALLPFLTLAVAGVWYALDRSYRNAQILEVLTLSADTARLIRHNLQGPDQEWECNIYWAKAKMHDLDGPVPSYVTLKGDGREVEIGAFLSQEERVALFDELVLALRQN